MTAAKRGAATDEATKPMEAFAYQPDDDAPFFVRAWRRFFPERRYRSVDRWTATTRFLRAYGPVMLIAVALLLVSMMVATVPREVPAQQPTPTATETP